MTELPGSKILRLWLRDNRMTLAEFSRMAQLDPSELSKLLNGKRCRVSVEQADKIERATKGDVNWRFWIPRYE